MIIITDQILLSSILPLDPRESNLVVDGSNIKVETFEEYFLRVDQNNRYLGLEVSFLEPNGYYTISDFLDKINIQYITLKRFRFEESIADVSLVEIFDVVDQIEIVDNLSTADPLKALSANQGTVLNTSISEVAELVATQGEVLSQLVENQVDVPVYLSDLTADMLHRTVTDVEKATWNAKQPSGSYEVTTNKVNTFQVTPDDSHYPTEKLVKDSLDGKQPAGSYAPALGIDDNYVTDAEKLALHAHSNKTALDNVSGTNTGDDAANSTANSYADGKVSDAISDGVTTIAPSQNAVFDALVLKENTNNKGANNGYAPLDSGGKVPIANLPSTLLKYIGQWNASTNTPILTNPDVTKKGYVYDVSVAGTQFSLSFKQGDWLIYNDAGVPEKSDNSDDVVTVNGQTGTVVVTKSDVGLGNVDNTSDNDKPVSSATSTALSGKSDTNHLHTGVYQPVGTYSTDIHSNITALNAVSGTNTGDDATNSTSNSYADNNFFKLAGKSGGQIAIGGLDVDDALTLQGTSGIGTSSEIALKMLVGNNGSINPFTVLNNGNIGIMNAAPNATLELGTTTLGAQQVINATLGAELFSSFDIANWTVTAGWELTNDGNTQLNHNGAGVTTALLLTNAPVTGNLYKVTFTVNASITGGFTVSYGGVIGAATYNPVVATPTTYSLYVRATAVTNLTFTPVTTAVFVITAISIKQVSSDDSGDLIVYGDTFLVGTLKNPSGTLGMTIDPSGNARFGSGIVGAGNISLSGTITGATSIASSSSISIAQSSTTTNGQTFATGFAAATGSATAAIPSNNSSVIRLGGSAWNGFITKVNQMEMYTNPDSEAITSARTVFKTGLIDSVADNQELVNISSRGRLNVLGRAQPKTEVFDVVFGQNSGTFTNNTSLASNFGQVTGDLINAIADSFYVGKMDTFAGIQYVAVTAKSTGGTFVWEYWNGAAWVSLAGVVDGTIGATGNLSQSGNITFTVPVDWATTTVGTTTAQIGPLYYARLRCTGSSFTTEPTASLVLPLNSTLLTGEILSDTTFDTGTKWTVTGDWAYTTNDYTFTYSSGSGTLTQASADFLNPIKPNTWYRFRCNVTVAGPSGTTAWIGPEVASGNTYFQVSSTTEIDTFFKTNSNPGNFVIYTIATTTSGLVLGGVSMTEMKDGDIIATGNIKGKSITSESAVFGDSVNNLTIGSNGTLKYNGTATVFDDVKFDALTLVSSGPGVSLNSTELTVDFTSSANDSDFLVAAPQLPHAWKIGSNVFPHIHFTQAQNAIPNFAIQYRWQLNGGIKTTAWTALKCNTTVFTYVSGSLNQICKTATSITPPGGSGISDIIQFKIIRDTTNALGLTFGADPYTGTVGVLSFDIHIELDSNGSESEYTK